MSHHFNEPEWLARQEAKDWNDDRALVGHAPIADNAAHAPGNVCELCHSVIDADQDVRRLPDGNWIHEACPIQ